MSRPAGDRAGSSLAVVSNRTASAAVFGEDGLAGRSCIGLLLSGGDVTGRASPQTAPLQKGIEIRNRSQRHARGADCHVRACRRVEHPGRNHRDDARQDLHMDELPGLAPVHSLDSNTTTEKRVPAIMNDSILHDMGRMNGR